MIANLEKESEIIAKSYVMCYHEHVIHFNTERGCGAANHLLR
jgi:hypothetical protein